MKPKIEYNNVREMRYKDLKVGDTFLDDANEYLYIASFGDINICLNSGEQKAFFDNDIIYPVNVTITIDEYRR